MPDAISIADAQAAANAPAASANRTDQFGKDTFLKLLIAQLKYQNPMNPTDGAQFMAQTAQFTLVEKLEDLAKSMDESLSMERSLAGSSMIGRQVLATVDGDDVNGVVTGARLDPTEGLLLLIGNKEVPLAAVREVHQPPAPTPSPAPTTPAPTTAPAAADPTPSPTTTNTTTNP